MKPYSHTHHSPISYVFIIMFFLSIFFSCSPDETESSESRLGEISIEVTGAEAAMPSFIKGLLLLHSFEYEDAREAFQETQAIDSTFVMAYWGEAMTHNHNLWSQQNKEKAVAALEKLAPSPEERIALAQTDLEKDFMQAVETLYGEEGTKKERDVKYRDFMEKLHDKYPNHHEVASLYALSILGAVPEGRDDEEYGKRCYYRSGNFEGKPQTSWCITLSHSLL